VDGYRIASLTDQIYRDFEVKHLLNRKRGGAASKVMINGFLPDQLPAAGWARGRRLPAPCRASSPLASRKPVKTTI
jgi:hypothetical protein